jgi:hypothetical protein
VIRRSVSATRRLLLEGDELEQRPPLSGERVERHLPVAAIVDQTGGAQGAEVVGDEILSALDDPSEIADTELGRVPERHRDRQPSRVRERLEALGQAARCGVVRPARSQLLRERKIETKEVATVVYRGAVILTSVDASGWLLRASLAKAVQSGPRSRGSVWPI